MSRRRTAALLLPTWLVSLAMALILVALSAERSVAAVDIFLKVDGIDGESKCKDHKDEIDVLAFTFGGSQGDTSHTGAGGGAGQIDFQDIYITKFIDKATPPLLLKMATGRPIGEAVLTVQLSGENPVDYVVITLTNVLVTSYSTGGSGDEALLTENVTFNYTKIKMEYREQDDRGFPLPGEPVTFEWDLEANKGN